VSVLDSNRFRFSSIPLQPAVLRYAVHGLAVELTCEVASVRTEIQSLLEPFAVADWPDGFNPVIGTVHVYDPAAVQRTISPRAVRFPTANGSVELYQDGDRFWIVNDQWGMVEIDLLKARWRTWLLPAPAADLARCVDEAVIWPLAQLLRARGLHLLPAVSVAKNGWGALILCPFGIEPELSALARNGYQVIGQRWTAVREEDRRIAMLHVPGWVERQTAPRLRYLEAESATGRLDLTAEITGAFQNHAFCDLTLIAEPGRRPHAHLRELPASAALNVLRRAWPLVDLHPNRKTGQIAPRLAEHSKVAELQLSRDPLDLLRLLEGFRPRPAPAAGIRRSHVAESVTPRLAPRQDAIGVEITPVKPAVNARIITMFGTTRPAPAGSLPLAV
jgi:hypothetical protein